MDEEVKLPGSSFDQVAKIIQGYALRDKELSLDEIAKTVAVDPTIVSRNHGFLAALGIIHGGQKKQITPLGKKLGDALSLGLEEEVRSCLREVVDSNEFLKNLVGAVRIRKGMDDASLRAHVAYSAGQSRSGGVMTGAGTVVEFLKRSGAIEDREGKYVASESSAATASETPQHRGQVNVASLQNPGSLPPLGVSILKREGDPSFSISIAIEVKCEAKDLEGLGARLRRVVDDFSNPPPLPEDDFGDET